MENTLYNLLNLGDDDWNFFNSEEFDEELSNIDYSKEQFEQFVENFHKGKEQFDQFIENSAEFEMYQIDIEDDASLIEAGYYCISIIKYGYELTYDFLKAIIRKYNIFADVLIDFFSKKVDNGFIEYTKPLLYFTEYRETLIVPLW